MEWLLVQIMTTLMREEMGLGMTLWIGLIGIAIWSPVFVPIRYAPYANALSAYALMATLTACFFLSLKIFAKTGNFPTQAGLLEGIAVGFIAIIVFLGNRRRASDRLCRGNVAEEIRQLRDADGVLAARLALWATLSLFPLSLWT